MNSLFKDTDLFTTGNNGIKHFELEDAELTLYENLFDKEQSDLFYNVFKEKVEWKQEDISLYGKIYITPRLTAWYGDLGKSYAFSGVKWQPYPWTKELLEIKEKIESLAGVQFNSVLLNLYRDGRDGVGWHRDNEKEFGTNPVIGSVSFGETRPFQLRHKFRKEVPKLTIPLTHGSFLLMAGATQHFWEHQVPKTSKDIQPRINLTFRLIRNSD